MKRGSFQILKYCSIFFIVFIYAIIVYRFLCVNDFAEGIVLDVEIARKSRIAVSILFWFSYVFSLRKLEAVSIGKRRMLDLSFGHFITAFCVNFVLGLICWVTIDISVIRIFMTMIQAIVVESAVGVLWIIGFHRLYEREFFTKDALFIYGNRENPGEYDRMRLTINRYFNISSDIDFHVGRDRLIEQIKKSKIVFFGDIPTQLRNELIKLCMQMEIDCYCIPKISDVYIQSANVRQLHDKLLLKFPCIGIQEDGRKIKRFVDVLVSFVLLLIFSPIMLIIALLIKLEDGGSVFYRQKRVTEGNREFDMLKFRSMRPDAEKKEITLARKDDDRITRIGRIIRNIHFDELPQLINILKGDMSLVGPRPERRQFIEEYSKVVPEFAERLKVKGGLTGYAQVYGKYNTAPEDKIKYDLYYIYNYSFWLDIKILLLTIRILFQSENTEGIDKDKKNAIK